MKGGTHAYDEIFLTLIKMVWGKKSKETTIVVQFMGLPEQKTFRKCPPFFPPETF